MWFAEVGIYQGVSVFLCSFLSFSYFSFPIWRMFWRQITRKHASLGPNLMARALVSKVYLSGPCLEWD